MKAIVCYPFSEKSPDEMCIGQSVVQSLINLKYEVKKITLTNPDGTYKTTAKDAFDLIQNGFNAQFVLAMDYGPWPGHGWNKSNFPNTKLIYEAGDEPQSMFSHASKLMQSDVILTPDARNASIYGDAFKKKCIWWPQFAMNAYGKSYNVETKEVCVTSCGDDRGPATKHMHKMLGERFLNKRAWKSHEDHAHFLSSGMIVFQESKNKEVTRRLMEGAALGRLVLADRPPKTTRYDELFVENEEIVWYDSPEDAVEKAHTYLTNPDACKKIGENAMRRVIKDHMVETRVKQLIESL